MVSKKNKKTRQAGTRQLLLEKDLKNLRSNRTEIKKGAKADICIYAYILPT
jgi:hypothetical protein